MENKVGNPEIFTIKATRCKRCGGILLSEFGLKNGMGHVCKKKADAESVGIIPLPPEQIATMMKEWEERGGENEGR